MVLQKFELCWTWSTSSEICWIPLAIAKVALPGSNIWIIICGSLALEG
jgi:hypothetical protein